MKSVENSEDPVERVTPVDEKQQLFQSTLIDLFNNN